MPGLDPTAPAKSVSFAFIHDSVRPLKPSFSNEVICHFMAAVDRTKAWRGDVYDAIVVGSGYSGSVAACRMSIVGVKVRLLEKSRRWKAQDFPTDSWEIM
uniref:Glucose-methanol-choline oxidoreductase N-terminal domain-containing protein n=1 Tax=Populus trichocarpa TaxID=3694 RepID=A0A2K2A5K7_POPTR